MKDIEMAARPDFIFGDEIARFKQKIGLLQRFGTPEQKRILKLATSTPARRENFYAGEWLGEQLRVAGLVTNQVRKICFEHGRAVGRGADAWAEAIRIVEERKATI